MPTISAGSSQTFTAGVRDQLFTLVVNGGALGYVTGAASSSFGPGADRRAFGPFAVGQAITVTVQAGSVIVEYGDSTPENEGAASQSLSGEQVAAGALGVMGVTKDGTVLKSDGSVFLGSSLAARVSPYSSYKLETSGLTWTPGGSGTYTVTPVNDPIHGNGYEITTGAATTDQGWVDITSASGIGYWTVDDVMTILVSAGVSNGGTQMSVRLANTTDPSINTSNYNDSLTNYSQAREIPLRLDTDTFAGSVSFTNGQTIKGIRFRVNNNGTAGASSIRFFGIRKNKLARTPTVLIDFDDGFISQYTQAFTYMRTRGVVGNVCVIAAAVGQVAGGLDTFDYASLDQLKAMHECGWGMITHGYFPHKTNLVTQAAIMADVSANQAYVAANFGSDGAKHYVYPAGQESTHSIGVFENLGIVTSRSTEKAIMSPGKPLAPYAIPSVQGSAFITLANLQKFYDRAKATGTGVRFQFHRIVTTVGADTQNEISIADFQSFITYIASDIQSGRVWNPNQVEWWNDMKSAV